MPVTVPLRLVVAALVWLIAASLPAQERSPVPKLTPGDPVQEARPAPEAAMLAFAAESDGNAQWVAAHGKAVAWLVATMVDFGRVRSVDVGAAAAAQDVASTAAALLAIGSSGSTLKIGERRSAVRHATKWLVEQQRADGWFCDPSLDGAALAHALATAAVLQTVVDSSHRPYEAMVRKALQPFGAVTAQQPHGEAVPLSIAAIAARHLGTSDDGAPGSPLGVARLSSLLTAGGTCSESAGGFAISGALPGTHEMAAVAVAMACRGTQLVPDTDPRWKALATRVAEMPTRFGKDGELLDAVTLWCAADVAHQLGGDARAAFERVIRERIVPRLSGATATGSITFACGPKVLRNEAAETALAALALAVPWFRVGR